MGLDRPHAQEQPLGHLAVRESAGDQPQYLELSAGQLGRRDGGRGSEASSELRFEIGAAVGSHPDRLEQLALGRLLRQIASRTQPQRLCGEARIALRGEHDHARPRVSLAESRDRREARLARHVQVEDEDIRTEPVDRFDGRRDITRLIHNLEARLRLDEQPQAAADDSVIVGQNDGERLPGFGVRSFYARNSTVVPSCGVPGPSQECRRVSDPRAVSATAVATSERRPVARGPLLSGLSVSHPSRTYSQAELLKLFGLDGDEFAEAIFARSGVKTRRMSLSRETLGQSLQARAAATEEQNFDMAVAALAGLDFDPADVGVLVTAGYWSIGGPTLAHRLIDHFALGPRTDKYHVTGVGCASAVPLLRLAGQMLRARTGERALVVAAESVSGFMTRALPGDERTKVVGSALFGDGCGAALLDHSPPEPAGPEIVASAVHQLPGSLDQVRFMVSEGDSYMQIGRELPLIAETQLPLLIEDFLRGSGLDTPDIDHWLLHPGGRGILEGAQRGLGLSLQQVAPSAAVLSEYGNVGTASSFFVLKAAEEMCDPRPGERGLLISIGPGVTVGLMLLTW
jgi:3,5-dihydroxyphenylacetyl-CoA synthase